MGALELGRCILFVLLVHSAFSSSWILSDNPLPQALFRFQTSYYPKSSTIFLFGGTHAFPNVNSSSESNKIYKWHMNQAPAQWIALSENTPTDAFYSNTQNSVSIGHLVYFIGVDDTEYLTIYTFNMETETFENNNIELPPLYPFLSGCLATNSSHMFLVGGWGMDRENEPRLLGVMQILDLDRNVWSRENILLPFIIPGDSYSGWASQQCAFVDDSLYVFGGQTRCNWNYSINEYVDGIYKYNTTLSMWSYHGHIASPSFAGWAVYSLKYNRIYISNGLYESMIQVFDIKQQRIIDTIMMNGVEQNETAALIVNENIMVFGGSGRFKIPDPYTIYSIIQTAQLPLITKRDNKTISAVIILIVCVVAITVLGFVYCIYRKKNCRKDEHHVLILNEGNIHSRMQNSVQKYGTDYI